MDALIAEDGEEGVLARVMTRIAIGDDPREIALGIGMPWLVLRKWLEDKEERMKEWELAKRCFADGLVYEGLREVRDCGLEAVPLARLRNESYGKIAEKLSRGEWGRDESRTMVGGAGGITIVIGSVEVPKLEVVSEQTPEPMAENVKEFEI
jgi:hypothetical protein